MIYILMESTVAVTVVQLALAKHYLFAFLWSLVGRLFNVIAMKVISTLHLTLEYGNKDD